MSVQIPFIQRVINLDGHLMQRPRPTDIVDRLHAMITPWMLAFCATLVGTKLYFGDPISCMFPTDIDGVKSWTDYFHQYCFVTGTYHYNSLALKDGRYTVEYQHDSKINYYQWVPFLLAAQMVCFLLPAIAWRYIVRTLNYDFASIIKESKKLNFIFKKEDREKNLNAIAHYLLKMQIFDRAQARQGFGHWLFGRRMASIGYISYKLICILNVLIQLFITAYYLGIFDFSLGLQRTYALFDPDLDNQGFGLFPRTSMCTVYKHTSFGQSLADPPTQYNVQCLLTINYINEKVFLIIWAWFILLLALSSFNLVSWLFVIFFNFRFTNAQGLYDRAGRDDKAKKSRSHKVFFSGLGADGRLLLAFIRLYAGDLVTVEIIDQILVMLTDDQMTLIKLKPTTPWNRLKGGSDTETTITTTEPTETRADDVISLTSPLNESEDENLA